MSRHSNEHDSVDGATRTRPSVPAPASTFRLETLPTPSADSDMHSHDTNPDPSSNSGHIAPSPQLHPKRSLDAGLDPTSLQPKPVSLHGISGHVEQHKPDGRHSISSYKSGDARNSTETQILTQDEKPWKYIGYRGYSEFLASENDFFMLRRFGAVSARVALMLQDRVVELEEELDVLDKRYSRREGRDVNNGTFREDEDDRMEILEKLRVALVRYNEFVLQQTELKKHPPASVQDIKSLENWHWNHEYHAIAASETKYLEQKHDLFSVVPKEKTPLRRLLEKSRRFRVSSLWKDTAKPALPIYDKDVITYISDKRIDTFVTVVIISVGMGMLIAPMWVLEFLKTDIEKLACITAFIVAFLGMISYASVAKPQEVLGATAAYSAVLMVFLQIGQSSGGI